MSGHVSTGDVARRLGVTEQSVRRWIKEEKLFATRRGERYRIPLTDAELFVSRYEQEYGSPLAPEIPARTSKYRAARTGRTAPGSRQSFYVTLDGPILGRIDAERRAQEGRVSRSDFVEAAVGHYLNFIYHKRKSEERKAVS